MLHELLFALSGHYGGLFKDTGCGIQVVKGVPFISPSEEVLLNRLCLLGTYFRKFTDFIHKHGLTSASQYEKDKVEVTGELHGLYLKSFCHGLDSVLDEYRSELRALESDILRDPHIGPSHLQCKLEEYHLLFPALSAVVEQLETQKAHGCYILEILHKNSASGLPMVKTALRRILHRCHRLLFKQLCAWTLHGMLTDHFREFFIQVADQASQNATESHDVSTIGGLTTQQIQQLVLDPLSSLPRLQRFVLRADLLPSYIPTRVANKILFVGESVQMFQTENKDFLLKQRGPVPREMEARFAAELLELSELEEFSLMRFEDTIDSIRECVAERLWMLVVEDSDLIGHLRVLKDFYLLGRGELYLAFIDQAQDMLSQPPTDTTQHDVNMTYLQAARNVLIADESLLQKFQLTITPAKSQENREKKAAGSGAQEGGEGIGDEGWRCLGLSYSVHWPLHILLTDGVLERYNTVFQFLLAVKRTQLKLQKCWLQQMQGGKSRGSLGELGKWQLRRHMAFLVDNLQYFLQVDVIESSFSILVEKIHTTRDFEAIKLAHDQFVARLLSQAFILMKPVSHCLNQILAVCSSFCRLMQLCDDVMTTQQIKAMENIAKKFQWQSSLLFKLLSSVRDHSASPHLAQLLLRLDYNRYFTTAGGQLGSL